MPAVASAIGSRWWSWITTGRLKNLRFFLRRMERASTRPFSPPRQMIKSAGDWRCARKEQTKSPRTIWVSSWNGLLVGSSNPSPSNPIGSWQRTERSSFPSPTSCRHWEMLRCPVILGGTRWLHSPQLNELLSTHFRESTSSKSPVNSSTRSRNSH